jgi:maltooligosyltrehalose trehalohydrolase
VDRAGVQRRLPVGAEIVPEGGVHFRIWAPDHEHVTLVLEEGGADGLGREVVLERGAEGYHAVLAPGARAGTRYRFRTEGSQRLLQDPASRYQPEGPRGPSQVVDPAAFKWSDGNWPGVKLAGQVFYEMHVGTFTTEGTWAAAMAELPELRDVGITVIEMMPVADFMGAFGWGYDGVDLFAPTRLYGEPDDLRRFVDRAHVVGLAVILDVVYNHVGPDGACLETFAADYFSSRYENEWGESLNFDGPRSGPVREFFEANAAYWIEEYHFDGLRLDATQAMHDASPEHILAAINRRARAAAPGRSVLLVAENESQTARLLQRPADGGYGFDAAWNDDYHHSAFVALTGHNEAYYSDHLGLAQEFVSAMKYGYLYQGQRYSWQRKSRGTPTWGIPPAAFVNFIENHDQVANSDRGRRMHQRSSPGRYRAITALTLLGPGTPMLLQGQEFATSSPFLYFADHEPPLADSVREGRYSFLAQFPSLGAPDMKSRLPDPGTRAVFERCRLDFSERGRHAAAYALHKDLLALRRQDAAFAAQHPGGLDGAVLARQAFLLRFFGPDGHDADRLLFVNLGRDLALRVAPEPLLAPPAGMRWETIWSSEDPRYDGSGTPAIVTDEGIRLPGEAAIVLGGLKP